MGSVERYAGGTFPEDIKQQEDIKMGPKNAIALMKVLVCCMMISNGKYAVKTRKNEMPTENRKIVKLLLRNFPLKESASYHNLVEDDEVGQPVAKGNHMTQYAPGYPYQEESMSSNQVNAFKFQEPTTKLVKKTKPDLSKFEYALSTILLPPPIPSDPPSLSSSFPNEENADKYYAPYMKYEQPNIENTADEYYLPYNQYAQQQQDDWLQYYLHNSEDSSYESFGELPKHSLDVLYEGPREDKIDLHFEELPTIQEGNQFSRPTSIDN